MDSETLIEQSISSDETIADYLSALVRDKNNLVTNLQNKGVEVKGNETFSELVPKVVTIPSAYAPKYISMMNHPGPEADFVADLAGLNTSAVKQISGIAFNPNQSSFYPSSAITINMVTPELVNTDCMFSTPINATSASSDINRIPGITFTHLDTGKVTSMRKMFCGCSYLKSLDVSSFTTDSGVEVNTSGMFQNCSECTSITLGNWNPTIVDASRMFNSCSKITSIDLSNMDFTKCTTLENLCSSCTALQTVNGINKIFNNISPKYAYMFYNCTNLLEIDLTGITHNIPMTTFSNMFYQCSNIRTIKMPNFISAGNCSYYYMFRSCQKLTTLDVSGWDTSNASNYNGMFMHCSSLTSLDLSSFTVRVGGNFSSVQNMFHGCTNLQHLDMRNWKFSSIPASASLSQMFGTSAGVPTIPVDCEIIVKDDTEKNRLLTVYPTFTNVKTVAEYEAE